MQHTLTQLAIFYHVVDLMSYSKAAQHLKVSKAFISKQITQLESNMSTKLLERNTRHLKLTFAGEELFKHSRNIILEYDSATQTMASLQEKPTGLLRITAPPAYAANVLKKQLPYFLKKHPDIQIDLKITGKQLNLFTHKIDIAIRQTHTPPADRIAKLLTHYQFQICASTDYLKQHPDLKHPQQLTEHSCLIYSTDGVSHRWPFIINNEYSYIDVKPQFTCNTFQAILEATLNDCGIARLPSCAIAEDIQKNNLQLLFTKYTPPAIPIYAIYAQSQRTSPAILTFVEFLQSV